ncbi:Single-stranded DNA-binding protein [Richelia intracellularis HH01]|uniref:Single-stranded DNA-binding protein n=1 Tax=Richelia intracellularis HH01 TaxID=1165094 RepID=M1X1D4_9NOST|nr:Single-stranded DNA-binding protein [Richelia intracellularis HH01]
MKFDSWSDRNTGVKRSKPVIVVDQLELLGSRKDTETAIMDSSSNNF